MQNYYHRSGNVTRVQDGRSGEVTSSLTPGVYSVNFNQNTGYYLTDMDPFELPSKLYGNTERQAVRVMDTFKDRTQSTGLLLTGEKGSGKTLLSKKICVDAIAAGMPVLLVSSPFTDEGFTKLIQTIGECVVLFDEFEKVYDAEDQEAILSLFDGVITTKKLFIITCNDQARLDANIVNRPGRMYYRLNYRGLTEAFITEYCQDVLKNKDNIPYIITVAETFSAFNFDMLKALVEELNRYGETVREAVEMLNMKPNRTSGKYTVEVFDDKGVLWPAKDPDTKRANYSRHIYGNVLSEDFNVEYFNTQLDEYVTVTNEDIFYMDNKVIKTRCKTTDYVVTFKKQAGTEFEFSFDFIEAGF